MVSLRNQRLVSYCGNNKIHQLLLQIILHNLRVCLNIATFILIWSNYIQFVTFSFDVNVFQFALSSHRTPLHCLLVLVLLLPAWDSTCFCCTVSSHCTLHAISNARSQNLSQTLFDIECCLLLVTEMQCTLPFAVLPIKG